MEAYPAIFCIFYSRGRRWNNNDGHDNEMNFK
jgi:hypothetical protein